MNKRDKESVEAPMTSLYASPYKDLYIYYLQGHVDTCQRITHANFIGNWQEDDFSFLFFSQPCFGEIERLLDCQPALKLLDQFQMTYEEWQGGALKPFVSGSFLITPPWADIQEEMPEREDEVSVYEPVYRILLDPGVVFGTGTHPTTHDCLAMLERLFSEEIPESVLDLGTGTGVLALAAAKLGAKYVLAADINLLAAKTTRRNIVLNRMEQKIQSLQGDAEDFINLDADLVIANIHYDVMKSLVHSEGFLRKKWFILSGLLRSQARDIAFRLSQLPVSVLKTQERDGIWHTFWGRIKEA